MKKCPFCAEEIQNEAIKCRYCGEFLEKVEKEIEEREIIKEEIESNYINLDPNKEISIKYKCGHYNIGYPYNCIECGEIFWNDYAKYKKFNTNFDLQEDIPYINIFPISSKRTKCNCGFIHIGYPYNCKKCGKIFYKNYNEYKKKYYKMTLISKDIISKNEIGYNNKARLNYEKNIGNNIYTNTITPNNYFKQTKQNKIGFPIIFTMFYISIILLYIFPFRRSNSLYLIQSDLNNLGSIIGILFFTFIIKVIINVNGKTTNLGASSLLISGITSMTIGGIFGTISFWEVPGHQQLGFFLFLLGIILIILSIIDVSLSSNKK